jgi:hypothetical protein
VLSTSLGIDVGSYAKVTAACRMSDVPSAITLAGDSKFRGTVITETGEAFVAASVIDNVGPKVSGDERVNGTTPGPDVPGAADVQTCALQTVVPSVVGTGEESSSLNEVSTPPG